ncbi:MAG: hypothetical protein KGZ58_07490 [Ignavibacteriales bacterium]|nr:hypothetical protein [Ignavibacteriales bacterium]
MKKLTALLLITFFSLSVAFSSGNKAKPTTKSDKKDGCCMMKDAKMTKASDLDKKTMAKNDECKDECKDDKSKAKHDCKSHESKSEVKLEVKKDSKDSEK